MKKSPLLYTASFLTLFTFAGHTAGAFMAIPADQTERLRVYQEMQAPIVTFPFGSAKSFADCLLGANLSLSVYLLVAGIMFILFARSKGPVNSLVVLNSLGMGAVGILSVFYFFPLPAICLISAGLLGLGSLRANG